MSTVGCLCSGCSGTHTKKKPEDTALEPAQTIIRRIPGTGGKSESSSHWLQPVQVLLPRWERWWQTGRTGGENENMALDTLENPDHGPGGTSLLLIYLHINTRLHDLIICHGISTSRFQPFAVFLVITFILTTNMQACHGVIKTGPFCLFIVSAGVWHQRGTPCVGVIAPFWRLDAGWSGWHCSPAWLIGHQGCKPNTAHPTKDSALITDHCLTCQNWDACGLEKWPDLVTFDVSQGPVALWPASTSTPLRGEKLQDTQSVVVRREI